MNNWDKGVAPAICPWILGNYEYSISAGAPPLDLPPAGPIPCNGHAYKWSGRSVSMCKSKLVD